MKKFKRSTVIPLCLLIYLAAMAYVGRDNFFSGNKLYYFVVLGISLAIIVLLHFALRKKEQLRQSHEEENQYGTYDNDK